MPPQFPTVLELVGATPIVRLEKLSPPGGAQILAKLEYLNPGGSVKDRIGLPMIEAAERDGKAEARRHDRRAHVRQHRRRPRDRGGDQGLPVHLRDARQDEPGEDRPAPRVRRRGRDHADRGRPRLARELLLRLRPARRGDPRRVQARPVLEHEQPGGALRAHRPGDLGADRRRRDRCDRGLGRHGRHDQRRRPVLQGTQAGGAHRRSRSGRIRVHGEERRRPPPVSRRGHRQGHVAGDDGSRRSSTNGCA